MCKNVQRNKIKSIKKVINKNSLKLELQGTKTACNSSLQQLNVYRAERDSSLKRENYPMIYSPSSHSMTFFFQTNTIWVILKMSCLFQAL